MARKRHSVLPATPAASPGGTLPGRTGSEPEAKAHDTQMSSAPEPVAEALGQTSAPGKRMAASTVTLRFDERGEPLEAKPETVERAREWLRKSGVLEREPELGPELPPVLLDEKLAEHVLDAIAYAQASLIRIFTGLPFDEVLSRVRLAREEHAELAPLTARVLQKHLPTWVAFYEDMAGLVLRLGVVEANKFAELRARLKQADKEAK